MPSFSVSMLQMISRFMVVLLLLLSLFSFQTSEGDSKYIILPSAGNQGAFSTNRHLLQVLTPCPVAFQDQNYTIITSVCKGPEYPVNACCSAFVKFACPFAAEINDNTTNCAATMFSYITNYGHYPAGLFANECKGDSQGLPCVGNYTANSSGDTSHAEYHLHQKQGWFWWSFPVICTALLLHLWRSG